MPSSLKHYLAHYSGVPKNVWMILFSVLANSSGNSATLFISLYLLQQLHMSILASGFVITVIGAGSIVGAYISGLLSDRYPVRWISITASMLNSVTLFTFSFVHTYSTILMLVFIMGFANSGFLPPNRILIMQSTPLKYHKRVNSVRYMMVNVGLGLGAFTGGIISKFNPAYIFIFNALMIFVSSLIMIFFTTQPADHLSETPIPETDELAQRKLTTMSWMFVTLFFFSLIFSQLRSSYPIYLNQVYHLSQFEFSTLFLFNMILIFLLQVPITNRLSRISEELIIGTGSILTGFGMFLLIFSTTYFNAFISAILWTLGQILFYSTMQAYIYFLADNTHKGKAMGIYQSIAYGTNIIGPIGGTWIYTVGAPALLWEMCLLFGIFSFLISFALYTHNRNG